MDLDRASKSSEASAGHRGSGTTQGEWREQFADLPKDQDAGRVPVSSSLGLDKRVVRLIGSQSAPDGQQILDRNSPLTLCSSHPVAESGRESLSSETPGTALRMRASSRGFRSSTAHSRTEVAPPPLSSTATACSLPSFLLKHLRPAPLALCFIIGLGAGLFLSQEPRATVQSVPSSPHIAQGVENLVHPGRASLEYSAGTTDTVTTDDSQNSRVSAAGRDTGRASSVEKRVKKGIREPWETGNASSVPPPPLRSPEEDLLLSLGTRELGKCEAFHHLDTSSVRPGEDAGHSWPLLLVVTPTYVRPFQSVFLMRLANTLRVVPPPILWIVVEIGKQSEETATLLRNTGLATRHLVSTKDLLNIKDRGVNQRNAALEHIEEHRLNGIVFFADDDNVYSPAVFDQMRRIRRFGVWPVGMLQEGKGRAIVEGPVCEGERVVGWHTNEKSKKVRRFHVDMCGFAFNSSLLWDPVSWGLPNTGPIRQLDTVKEGFQETTFIQQLVADESEMQGLGNGCSDVMVWHLHSEALRTSPFPHTSAPPSLTPVIVARQTQLPL